MILVCELSTINAAVRRSVMLKKNLFYVPRVRNTDKEKKSYCRHEKKMVIYDIFDLAMARVPFPVGTNCPPTEESMS
jgi:hypothetical protein